MPISVTCTVCTSKLRAPDRMAGRVTRCPKCGSAVIIATVQLAAPVQPAADVSRGRTPRPALKKKLRPRQQAHDTLDVSSGAPVPAGTVAYDYVVDIRKWFRLSGDPRNSVFVGPMIGYFFILLGVTTALALLSMIFIGVFGYIFLLPQLAAGPTIVCLAQLKGQHWTFGDFFGGFRRYGTWLAIELLGPLFGVAGILPGLLLAMMLGAVNYALGVDPHREGPWLVASGCISGIAMVVSELAALYIWFRANIFVRQIVIETNCGVIEGFKASWRLTRGHFWGLFGSVLLMLFIVYFAGAITCGIGLLLALPRGLLFWNAGYLLITGRQPLEPSQCGPPIFPEASGPSAVKNDSVAAAAGSWSGRARWPWVAGGAALLAVLLLGVVAIWRIGGGGSLDDNYQGPPRIAKAIRAQQALIDANRGQKLFPNHPNRDVVVVLKIQGVRGGDRIGLFTASHVIVNGEKRELDTMTIPADEKRAIWAAAVVPIDAQVLTLVLGDTAPLTCLLKAPVIELARMSD